jgi:hypothetical protein
MHSRTTSVNSVPRVVYVTKTRFTDWSIRKTLGDSVPRVVYVIKARFNDWSIMVEGLKQQEVYQCTKVLVAT